jgi:hypothetical protein
MSDIINLFKPNKDTPFNVDKIDNNPIISKVAPEAGQYLQEIKLVGATIRCCVLKDVGNPNGEDLRDGDYQGYKLSMLTLPGDNQPVNDGISYVDYEYDYQNAKLKLKPQGKPLTNSIHTLVMLDVSITNVNSPLHFCSGSAVATGSNFTRRPYACFNFATTFRTSLYKPFHIFKLNVLAYYATFDKPIETNNKSKMELYLIPIAMSEGIIAFFTLDTNKVTDIQKNLDELAKEIVKVSKDPGDHWCTNAPLTYNDDLGIFICEGIKSSNNIDFPI